MKFGYVKKQKIYEVLVILKERRNINKENADF